MNGFYSGLQTITSTLGALDKVAVGQADIYGMATDANLVGQQYSCEYSLSCISYDCCLTGRYLTSCDRDQFGHLHRYHNRRSSSNVVDEALHHE